MASVLEIQSRISELKIQLAQVEAAIANPATLPIVVTTLNADRARIQGQLAIAESQLLSAQKSQDQSTARVQATSADAVDNGSVPLSQEENDKLSNDRNVPGDGTGVPVGINTVNTGASVPPEPAVTDKTIVLSVNGKNKPKEVKPNPLHDYNNYSYLLTLHLLNQDTYSKLVDSRNFDNGKVVFKSDNVLIASAGKYSEKGTRNPEWKENFFIENLNVETIIGMSSLTQGTNSVGITFDIVEPYGLTLMERLIKSSLATSYKNYLEMVYALQIEFIGYDEEGNIKSLPNHTKYIPIKFAALTFKVTEQGTVYKVSATPYSHQAFNASYATAPIAMSVTAATVEDYFSASSDATPDIGASPDAGLGGANVSTSKYVYAASWCSAVNKYEQQRARTIKDYIPDSYNIIFHPDIGPKKLSATLKPRKAELTNTPMDTSGRRTAISDPRSTTFNPNANTTGTGANTVIKYEAITQNINAGNTLISEINRVVRNSEFFLEQFAYKDPLSLQEKTPEELAKIADEHNKELLWWRIIPEIRLKGFDYSRNTYAKEITYYVNPYSVPYNPYPYTPKVYPQPVKRYDYLFTGKNTDVLDFNLDFNTAYYVAVTTDMSKLVTTGSAADMTTGGKQEVPAEYNKENIANVQRRPTSGQVAATSGAATKRDAMSQLTADLQELLFSKPSSDLIVLDMKIVGDPDFIKQDDIFSGANTSAVALNNSLPMDTGDVYIRVVFKTPTDFDEDTGLPTKSTTSKFSGLYRVVSVTNSFSSGTFTQKLNAVRIFLPGDYDFENKVEPEKTDNSNLNALTISRNVYNTNATSATNAVATNSTVNAVTVSAFGTSVPPAITDPAVSNNEQRVNSDLKTVAAFGSTTRIGEESINPVQATPVNTYVPKAVSTTPANTTQLDDGVYQFTDPLGTSNAVVVNTQEGVNAIAAATKTGQIATYVDKDPNLGWVKVAYNPANGTRSIQEEYGATPPESKK
tara:strand:- start:16881 stop:19808 length:2928 start_codon:yes stop_codon:yes gene_type:complete